MPKLTVESIGTFDVGEGKRLVLALIDEAGVDQLHAHAIAGFTGEKGMMPPKGGNAALSDDEVKAAVDFMVAKSK